MFVPLPLLILAGLVFVVLLGLALRPRRWSDDLLSAPRVPVRKLAVRPGQRPDLPPEVDAQVRALVADGQAISAIKLVREATGLGLKEAKDMVDGMRQTGLTAR